MNEDSFFFKDSIISLIFSILFMIFMMFVLYSCTLSFQNIDTHGSAKDFFDEQEKNDLAIKLKIPLMP